MQARRVLSLSAISLATACSIAMLGACGDDDQTIIYVYVDGGVQDTGRRDVTPIVEDDSGDEPPATCNPAPVGAFTFKVPGKYLGKCTDAQLSELYDGCLTDGSSIQGCKDLQEQLKDCSSCALGPVVSEVAHPWLQHDERVTAFPNFGLCMATFKGETEATECGVAYGQFYPCLAQACVTSCVSTGPDSFDACRRAALDNGLCSAGAQVALGTKCGALYESTNKTYGFCTSITDDKGNKLDDKGYMLAIARLTCGFDPNPDAGTDGGDAGDAGPASDAGDAGDADADANP